MSATTIDKERRVKEITGYLRLSVAFGRFDVWQSAVREVPGLKNQKLNAAVRELYLNQPKDNMIDEKKQLKIIEAYNVIEVIAGKELLELDIDKIEAFDNVIAKQANSLMADDKLVPKVLEEVVKAREAFLKVPKRK